MVTLADIRPADLQLLQAAVLDRSPVSLGARRTSSPHEFYRYPARFAPSVAAAAILAFSDVGDTVGDFFVGGGTSLVEARLAGRFGVGSDINSLATFVSRVKTRIYSRRDLEAVRGWATSFDRSASARWPADIALPGYFRNFDGKDTAEQRALILRAFVGLELLPIGAARDLARCILLRTAQWALDMRSEVPSGSDLRIALLASIEQTVSAAWAASSRYRAADQLADADGRTRSLVIDRGLPGLAGSAALVRYPSPALIMTSPPYPGVYVNYHRWKLRGRLETPLPYFIAGQSDGHGIAHYTMAARSDKSQNSYFKRLEAAFADIAAIASPRTWIVQVVGFSNVETQLPRYLLAMSRVGLSEYTFSPLATADDGRLWRDVPGRRWWARAGERSTVATHTAQEVVLIHRLGSG